MRSYSTVIAAFAFFSTASALPARPSSTLQTPACESTPTPSPSTVCKPGRIVAPKLITLSDTNPEKVTSEPSGNTLSLSLGPKGENQDQIALFEGIPAGAKQCTFGWKQREKNTQDTFKANGNALVEFRSLPEDGPFSYTSVRKLIEDQKPSHVDLTFWDQPEYATSRFHSGGSNFDCAEDIYMHFAISKLDGETGGVLLEGVAQADDEDDLQGVFLEWTC